MSSSCDVASPSFTSHDADTSGTVTAAQLCDSAGAMFFGKCSNSGFYASFFPNGASFASSMCIYDLDRDGALTKSEFLCGFVFQHGASDQLHSSCCPVGEIPERRTCCAELQSMNNCSAIGVNITTDDPSASMSYVPSPPSLPPSGTSALLDEALLYIIIGGASCAAALLLLCCCRGVRRANSDDAVAAARLSYGMDSFKASFRKRWTDNLQPDGSWLAPISETFAESFKIARRRWTGEGSVLDERSERRSLSRQRSASRLSAASTVMSRLSSGSSASSSSSVPDVIRV